MGARILRRRKEKGLTQEALANKLGVSNQAVSKWEGDVCCPDLQLLPLLADTLELSLDELFGPTVYNFKNIKNMVKRAELGTSLSLRELLEISNALRTIRALSA